MTSPVRKVSDGERRLAGYLRLCDYVIYVGLSGSAATFVFGALRVAGLSLAVVSFGAALKLAGVIVAYLLMSSRTPNADIAPWIRRWTRTASVLMGLAAVYALIAGHDAATRLLAGAIMFFALLLYRRVGSVAIGELSEGWGPQGAQDMFLVRGVLGPELDAWLTGIWLAGAIVVRAAMPSAFQPAPVSADGLRMRVLAAGTAELRYHTAHRTYSSDIAELRPFATGVIDSLVVVTVDGQGFRAIARDPRGTVTCGIWGGETTGLRIAGAALLQTVCWRDTTAVGGNK